MELYKSGSYLSTVAKSTESDGDLDWQVPQDILPGADYRIRVTNEANPELWDESDENFEILICTTSWIGTVNSKWLESGNWDNGVPDSDSVACILPATNSPVVDPLTDACFFYLHVHQAAKLLLDGGTLEGGNAGIDGDLVISANSLLVLGP